MLTYLSSRRKRPIYGTSIQIFKIGTLKVNLARHANLEHSTVYKSYMYMYM